ncbi:MAG TPA: T9SS type A sorting domain-containing protein, partial [Bacteroidetes bacterium]|nr:T9SS type A sorting domain-containing protein [Bacteroidota bacterium]
LDLFITSVYEGRQPYLYHNEADGTFTNVNYPAGFHMNCYNSWGAAWCDYDHDGDLDIAVGGNHGGLYQNNGDAGHYLQVEMRGVDANRFAFGCRAEAHAGDLHMLRQVQSGMGTGGCQNMMALHFGLGENETVDSLIVSWLGGDVERYFDLPADQRYIAVQGEGLLNAPPDRSEPEPPAKFRLDPPCPNPFNSSVMIRFAPGAPGEVTIAVYDLAGRRVAVLADGCFTAATHSLTWDASALSAGSYIVQARFEGGLVTQNLTSVK